MNEGSSNSSNQFTRLWVKAQPAVSSFLAASIRDHQAAEDLLQEVALAAHRDFAQYDPARPFLSWVLGIARFRLIDHFRRSNRDRLVFAAETLEALAGASVEIQDEMGERKEALHHCIQKLAPRGRRALEMRYQRNQTTDQIAEQLGVSNNAVFVLLHRVRNALGQCIEQAIAKSNGGRS